MYGFSTPDVAEEYIAPCFMALMNICLYRHVEEGENNNNCDATLGITMSLKTSASVKVGTVLHSYQAKSIPR
jgi:hypothetical protein